MDDIVVEYITELVSIIRLYWTVELSLSATEWLAFVLTWFFCCCQGTQSTRYWITEGEAISWGFSLFDSQGTPLLIKVANIDLWEQLSIFIFKYCWKWNATYMLLLLLFSRDRVI